MFKQYFQLRISEVNISAYFLNHNELSYLVSNFTTFSQHGVETKMRLTMAIGKCKSGHIMIRGGMCSPTRPQQVHYYSISREELNSQFLYNENFNRKMQDKSKVLVYNLFSYVKWIVPHEHRLKLDFHVSDPYCLFHVLYYTGCFFHWYPPKKLKYGKPRLGESTLT